MHRDPTPPNSYDAHLQNTYTYTSPRKSNPSPWTGGSYGATGVPSHGPSTSFGGHPGQDFGGPMPQQNFNSFGRGHTPAASWSGPDGAYTTPAFTQPPRDARDTDQTYTSPEMARAGPSFGGLPGPFAGMNPIPLAGPSAGYDAPYRVERFSMPVSDEELRTTADIINGTRTFVVPIGSLSGPGAFDFLDGPFPLGFALPHPHPEQDPWDKSASIHTLYSELPKESTPPTKKDGDAGSDTSRAPTVPPKVTPRISQKTVPATHPDTPETAPVEEKANTSKPASPGKTPRMADLHLPSDPGAAPAIRLQAPTTTDPTAVTASKSTSTPATDVTAHSAANSSFERPKWDAAPRESFRTAQTQPQLPAYQSQPSSPQKPTGQPFFPPNNRSAPSSPKKTSAQKTSNGGPNGTPVSEKARKEKQAKEPKRHSGGDNRQPQSAAPSYSTTHTLRGIGSVMSPETMTTNISRELKQPDHVTERLYAWAREKSEVDFVETLERLSGGDEVSPTLRSIAATGSRVS